MTDRKAINSLRAIPSIDEVLSLKEISTLRSRHPRFPWTRFSRMIVDSVRGDISAENSNGITRPEITSRICKIFLQRFQAVQKGGMKRVLNGTGVILHTNLGRAVLGERARRALEDAMSGYVNLEYDLSRGERGSRTKHLDNLLRLATGSEASMVVNNNAAAVYMVAGAFSPPGRVLISRGELVEIGGSFRLPAILNAAAKKVIEIGTTNRTFIEDYGKQARKNDIILKVHKSNYEISGFAHEASLEEIVELAACKRCISVYDLGSGSLFDFASRGIGNEKSIDEIMDSGVDCVTMSGDKLLGGVQAGIILCKSKIMKKLETNPLRRAVRADKIAIAALEALIAQYLFAEDYEDSIPVLAQALQSLSQLTVRAEAIIRLAGEHGERSCSLAVVDDISAAGGGSFPCEELPGKAVAIICPSENSAVKLEKIMRTHTPPILTRIKGRELRVNLRTILPGQDEELGKCLGSILGK